MLILSAIFARLQHMATQFTYNSFHGIGNKIPMPTEIYGTKVLVQSDKKNHNLTLLQNLGPNCKRSRNCDILAIYSIYNNSRCNGDKIYYTYLLVVSHLTCCLTFVHRPTSEYRYVSEN